MKFVFWILVTLVGLAFLIWVGLQIAPRPFPDYPEAGTPGEEIAVPHDLPHPVKRFYRGVYGGEMSEVHSAVITGRGKMRIQGLRLPVRFRFTHDAGEGYHHYIEATLYGFPILTVNEYYLEGKGRMELPFGIIEDEPKVNQGANLGLWAESIWFPALFLTDSHVRWEAIDEVTASLVVPLDGEEERFIARFDPQSGMLTFLESMRYKGAEGDEKILWINEAREWGEIDGHKTLVKGALVWFDEGSPWFVFQVEDVSYNVDVDEYIRVKGP
jgi:hypothetical protein